MDRNSQRDLLADAATRSADYLDSLNHRSVFPKPEDIHTLEQVLQEPLGDRPSDPFEVLSILDQWGSPATVANAGGRYFGFVTGGALPATVAAHCLATAWDQNASGFMTSPAIALFESTALRWLTDILHLPSDAEGTLVTGATMANFVGLAAARSDVLHRVGWDVERQGLFGAPEITVMVGDEVHGTVLKVLAMLGLGRDRVIRIPVDRQGRMRPEAIPEIHGPTILCLQAGNVNSGAFDPAAEIIPNVTNPHTQTEQVLKAIETQGQFWCGGTHWHGQRAMRISVSSWATTQADLEITLQSILDARDRVGEVGRSR